MNLKEQNKRKRISYAVIFAILVALEALIALFVHDSFIRPYMGDILIVIVLYAAVRIIFPEGCKIIPLYIFLFSIVAECLQYFDLAGILGVADNKFLRILFGSVFDIKDIFCYGAGCILLGIYEWKINL